MMREFEKRYLAQSDSYLPLDRAQELYEELWQRALDLGAVDPSNPLEGLDADIEMARTLNGLPCR